jgi:RimJ/RimL family protein N-acetyltransferase
MICFLMGWKLRTPRPTSLAWTNSSANRNTGIGGIGTRAIRLMLVYLFHSKQAAAAVVDPHVENLRAIHCYEKCGFRKIKLLAHHELHEGVWSDSWLMRAEP